MELSKEELTNLKLVELEILKSFICACQKLNLQYYLIGGTLIGAIRHKGFIPWDDDIDVIMPRRDYDAFVQSGQQHLPEGMFLQTHTTDPEYPCCFAKVRDTNTTFVESTLKSRHINHGIYIDVFPLDYYPTSSVAKLLTNLKDLLLNASSSRLNDSKPSAKMRMLQIAATCFYPSAVRTIDKRSNFLRNQNESPLVRNYCGAWGMREIWEAGWFGKGVEVEFEGIEAIAPSNYDAVLRKLYGEYMQLPPEEKRVAHHFCERFDVNHSYRDNL